MVSGKVRQAIPGMGYETPTEFARAAGISSSVVSRWLNDLVRPDVPLLERAMPSQISDLMWPGRYSPGG